MKTALACWAEYARGVDGAFVQGDTAVFPHEPERGVYNNAVLDGDLPAVEALYARAGVDRFAVWVHERDSASQTALQARGYVVEETTLAMGMSLDALTLPRTQLDLVTPPWDEYLATFDLPAGLLAGSERRGLRLLAARVDGELAATVLTFDHEGDCGVYNVTTVEHARRRGLATTLTAYALHDAVGRGCRTATLQATAMA